MKASHVCIALLLVLAGAPARAERLDTWTVVGLRAEGEPPLRDDVATLRGALSLELSARGIGVVIDEESTRLRLGMAGDIGPLRERIETAELYYFQLELAAARANLEQALAELIHASGLPEAWERTRDARMLLAMVHLAGGDEAGRAKALEQLEAIARVDAEWSPSEMAFPREVVDLYGDARRRLALRRNGVLRVDCSGVCERAVVFVDVHAAGGAGEAIQLPPGHYGVVLADREERPDRRSIRREIEIVPGETTTVSIDLEREGRLSAEEGPVAIAAADPALRRTVAAHAARRAASDFTLVLQHGENGGWRAWILDASGAVRRELTLDPQGAEPLASLAHEALAERLDPATPAAIASALAGPVAAPPVDSATVVATSEDAVPAAALEAAPEDDRAPSFAWTASKWGATGGALLAAAAGIYLRVDADQRDADLRSRLDGWGGTIPSLRSARAARDEADAIASQTNLANGLLVGAGALGAAAITLFLLEPDAEEPAVRW